MRPESALRAERHALSRLPWGLAVLPMLACLWGGGCNPGIRPRTMEIYEAKMDSIPSRVAVRIDRAGPPDASASRRDYDPLVRVRFCDGAGNEWLIHIFSLSPNGLWKAWVVQKGQPAREVPLEMVHRGYSSTSSSSWQTIEFPPIQADKKKPPLSDRGKSGQ